MNIANYFYDFYNDDIAKLILVVSEDVDDNMLEKGSKVKFDSTVMKVVEDDDNYFDDDYRNNFKILFQNYYLYMFIHNDDICCCRNIYILAKEYLDSEKLLNIVSTIHLKTKNIDLFKNYTLEQYFPDRSPKINWKECSKNNFVAIDKLRKLSNAIKSITDTIKYNNEILNNHKIEYQKIYDSLSDDDKLLYELKEE